MKKIFFIICNLWLVNTCIAQVDLNLGLRAYYPFSGNANDVSGNNNNPSFNNATLTADRLGNPNSAYRFNGTNQYMQIPNSASLNMTNKITLCAWVKPIAFYQGFCYNNAMIMKQQADFLDGTYSLRYSDVFTGCTAPNPATERFFGSVGSGTGTGGCISQSLFVQLSQWYSVVYTNDGTTGKLYINCVLQDQQAVTNNFSATNALDLFFGKMDNVQYPYWLNADMDEIRIYDRALNQDEVNVYGGCIVTPPCFNSFQKIYGGAKDEAANTIVTNTDSSYLIGGNTNSFGNGGYDIYLQKIDKNGKLLWNKTIGGTQNDLLSSIKSTPDGYILAGNTSSFGGGTNGVACLIKIDANGNIQWSRKYDDGNSSGSSAWDVTLTSDGGYAISGVNIYTPGLANSMVVKTDNLGNVQWAKSFDSGNSDQSWGILEDADSLVVTSLQYGASSSLYNAVIMKLKRTDGSIVWARNYDIESKSNWPRRVFKNTSGGYSFDVYNDVAFSLVSPEVAIVNTDINGAPVSLRKIAEEQVAFQPTTDGGFILIKRTPNVTANDIQLIKANSSGITEWAQKYAGAGLQSAYAVKQTLDGGYILAGVNSVNPSKTDSNNIYIIKTDALGNTPGCAPTSMTATFSTPTYVYQPSFIWGTLENISFGNTSITVTGTNAAPFSNTLCVNQCSLPDTIINNYTPVIALNLCTNALTVEDASLYNIGDTVLLIQMKGAVIDSTNTNAFGTVTDYKNAGNYEFNYVKNKTGNIIELLNAPARQYDIPVGKVQLVRVPYFTNYIATSTLTCLPWDGSKGGVLVLNVQNNLTLNAGINVNGKGFRGGTTSNFLPNTLACFQDAFFASSNSTQHAAKGEGIADISSAKLNGRGNLANGGGGGNGHNAGGGGGSNTSIGGIGGYQLNNCGAAPYDNRGKAGIALNSNSTINKIFMGGGGGAGHNDNTNPNFRSPGGNGGGIAIIIANTIQNNNNLIVALGNNGENCKLTEGSCHHDAMGGGGAGGTVLIKINNYTDTIKINAKGAKGDDVIVYNAVAGKIGPGGGGSGGTIYFNSAAAPTKSVLNIDGGTNGVIIQDANNPWGAGAGSMGNIFNNLNIPIASIPFKKNIDSVRFSFVNTPCTADFSFTGIAYINTSPMVDWRWTFGDAATSTSQIPSHTYATPGTYTVKLVVTDINGCKDSVSRILEVIIPATPSIIINTVSNSICKGDAAIFIATATNGGTNPLFQWQKNGINVGTNNSIYSDAALNNGDIIKCRLTSSISCATPASVESNSITMMVSTAPANMRYPTLEVLANQSLQLQARVFSSAGYEWKPATGLSNALIINPVFTFGQDKEYLIYIRLSSGCQVIDTQLVKISGTKGIYVPKAFSPNGDGTNDRLYPILVGIKQLHYFRLYNRWGNLVFQTTSGNPANGWNGYYKGLLQPVETYTWVVEGIDIDGIVIKKSGSTLLIR